MKLLKIKNLWMIALLFLGLSLTSCSNDDDSAIDNGSDKKTEKALLSQYVDNTVINTYHNLADASLKLEAAVEKLNETKQQSDLEKACEEWKNARQYWEQSEAFLFGPAAERNIDPHIDSWPLDKSQLDQLLNDDERMKNFDGEYAGTYLGFNLLGFHALEYVLFRDGAPRKVSDLKENEFKYAVGVVGDMTIQTLLLEAGWAGIDKVSAEKKQRLEDAEIEVSYSYGDLMKKAGEPGNLFSSTEAGIQQLLRGCIDITDEVGNTKITDPVNSGNVLDVESWYSWNSLEDFQNNIRSIENAYLGGVPSERNEAKSVSAYIKSKDANLDSELKSAIQNAISEINKIGHPFRNHLTEGDTKKAVEACNTLMSKLEQAKGLVK